MSSKPSRLTKGMSTPNFIPLLCCVDRQLATDRTPLPAATAQPPVMTLTPPSTASHWPVMCLPASEANNSVTPFRSSSSPRRCSGACAARLASPSCFSVYSVILLGKKPGQIALTVMLYLPHSHPSARVKLTTAPLDVL